MLPDLWFVKKNQHGEANLFDKHWWVPEFYEPTDVIVGDVVEDRVDVFWSASLRVRWNLIHIYFLI